MMRTLTREECYEKIQYIILYESKKGYFGNEYEKKGWTDFNREFVNPKSAVNTMLFLAELPKDIESPRPIFISCDENIHLTWQTSLAHRIKHRKEHYISMHMHTEGKTITIKGTAFGEHQSLINTTHDFSNGIPENVIKLLREITAINATEKQ
jgi:hypothetical protein